VVLINRNIKKAQLLATTIISSNSSYDSSMIEIRPFNDLPILLNEMQLLVTATSASSPIITKSMVKNVKFSRYWFDIALPRDIDVVDVNNINIYAIDDLKDIVDKNLNVRATQAKEAYLIISSMTKEFYKWLGILGVEPMIKSIYIRADDIIQKKVKNAISKNFITSDNQENVTKLCQTIMKEFLHTTTLNLREASQEANSDKLINTIKLLYGIDNLEDD
jgi:glutamyl-tRNA reductase